LGWDTRNQKIDHALLRRTIDDFRRVENCLLGDFYPLTPYGLAEDSWMAWQLDRPEAGEGVIQAFRHEKSQDETMILRLHGLNPRAVYLVKDLDREAATRMPGRELMEKGLPVNLGPRQSAVICYRRVKTGAGR
jgi:alpha-galactosidase